MCPAYFQFFHTSPYFYLFLPYSLHVLSKKMVGMSGKGQAFGFYRFLNFWVFSCLWASWVVLAAAFWEVQGISNTPRIISPLEKSHEIAFNLALSCSGFPNLSYFPLFRNISPIFLSFASKERWYAFGFYMFLSLFPASGQVGWSWQLPTLIFEERRASPIPLK